MSQPSPAAFVLGLALAVALSLFVFSHAQRHGSRHATAWGVGAFLLWVVVPIYFILFWLRRRPRT